MHMNRHKELRSNYLTLVLKCLEKTVFRISFIFISVYALRFFFVGNFTIQCKEYKACESEGNLVKFNNSYPSIGNSMTHFTLVK